LIYLKLIYLKLICYIKWLLGGIILLKRIVQGLKSYFSDKKNRIVHIVMGISLLIGSVFDSISPYLRIGLYAGAISFNLIRMRYF